MAVRFLDMDQYKRRAHFEYFRSLAYPYVGVTCEVEVTKMLRYCQNRGRSFYLACIHAVALAADSVPELRQRIRGNRIVEYDACPTSHIELEKEGTYHYCTLHHDMGLDRYFEMAEEARHACRTAGVEEDDEVESAYFISVLPWLHYTSLIQPAAGGEESNPRITWGRYDLSASGEARMPVSILAHHALVDGIHIAQFYDCLKNEIEKFALEG